MTKARLLADFLSSAAASAENEIVLGDSGDTKLIIPGLGFNTDLAEDGQIIIWNDSQNRLEFTNAEFGASVDSAQTILLIQNTIDSAYINNRVTIPQAYGDNDVISLVDSAYIQVRQSPYQLISGGLSSYVYTADSGQTQFSGVDDNGKTLSFTNSNLAAYLNGVLLQETVDYTLDSGSTLTITFPVDSGNEISILAYDPTSDENLAVYFDSDFVMNRVKSVYAGDRTLETYRFVSTEGQTFYSGNDANGNSLNYTPSSLQVHLNGILLTPGVDYVATNGTDITLQDSIGAGNEIVIDNFQTRFIVDISQLVDSAYVGERIPKFSSITEIGSFKFTTIAPQVVFTGPDDNGNTLLFDSDNIIVFLNGVNLYSPNDYFTTNGNTITLTEPTDSDFQLIAYNFNKYFTAANSNNILTLSSDPVPDSSGAAGIKGTVIVNNNYMYVCKENNVWIRTIIDGIW
jgi:hypothetical protein